MTAKIPENRHDLIHLYSLFSSNNKNHFINLDPTLCARARDLPCFEKASFETDSAKLCPKDKIKIGTHDISWIIPKDPHRLMNAVGLSKFTLREPCKKRISFIENRINKLWSIYPDEINFIAEFTSNIYWLEPESDMYIGSAAFYEIPHATFFSDAAMFSLPPEIIVPQEFSEYAIFENLYHEALHHQMHAYSVLSTEGYLLDPTKENLIIQLPWRDRTFTLLEAIHALHVYASVTPLRLRYCQALRALHSNVEDSVWIENAYRDSLRMWKDLAKILIKYINGLKDPWPGIVSSWSRGHTHFV